MTVDHPIEHVPIDLGFGQAIEPSGRLRLSYQTEGGEDDWDPIIDKLTAENLNVTLAVSLHAPDDELRDTLVPINTRWKVGEVLDAAARYATTTKRRVSIEYALIRDINDQAWRADLLGKVLREKLGHLVHVNLIPLNPTPGSKWTASRSKDEREFVRQLENLGVAVTVRDTRGREIDGACGQLAAATAKA